MAKVINSEFKNAIDEMIDRNIITQGAANHYNDYYSMHNSQEQVLPALKKPTTPEGLEALKAAVAQEIAVMPDAGSPFNETNRGFAIEHGVTNEEFEWFQAHPENDSPRDFAGILVGHIVDQLSHME